MTMLIRSTLLRNAALLAALLLGLAARAQLIQPALAMSTWFGGADEDQGLSVACAADGAVCLAGRTFSASTIATPGAHQSALAGAGDAFLALFNADGQLSWCSYLGGPQMDRAFAVTVGSDGRVYVAGGTSSSSGIATPGAHQVAFGGTEDGFLACFEATGQRVWGTYFGGSASERIMGLAVTANGDLLIVGGTNSTSGIATTGAHQTVLAGSDDAFLARFSPAGQLLWSTYLGGGAFEEARAVGEDPNGDIVITGITRSPLGIAQNGHQNTIGDTPFGDAFLVKFTASGQRIWGSYLGGTDADQGQAIAIDADGNVLLAGSTNSFTGIAFNGHQMMRGPGVLGDAFLAKFSPAGILLWATYYGGSGDDQGLAVAVTSGGDVYLAGLSGSASGISTPGPWQQQPNGGVDAFVAAFTAQGVRLWGLFHGGPNGDGARGMDIAPDGGLWLAGNTASASGMATAGAHQTTYGGSNDAFLMRLMDATITGSGRAAEQAAWLLTDPGQDRVLLLGGPYRDVRLRAINGHEVRRDARGNTLSLAGLAPGIYVVEAVDGAGVVRSQRVLR